jgi:cytochrome c oxidase subunit I
MTLTASPGSSMTVDQAAFGDLANAHSTPETWFTTTDHRTIGGLMAGISLVVGLVGTVLASLVSLKLDDAVQGKLSESGLLSGSADGAFSFSRIFSAQRHGLLIMVAGPLFLALATLAVPRMIGSTRLAFPRLGAFSLWAYEAAMALFIASIVVGDGPSTLSLVGPTPSSEPMNHATGLALGAFAVVAVVMTLGAVNIVTTVLTQRAPGLRLGNVAPYVWASFVTAGITLISAPVFAAGLLITFIDRHFNSTLYAADGFSRVYTHTLWFFGRPDALLLILPALGIASQIVANTAGKSLLGGPVDKILLSFFGVLTLGAWAGGDSLLTAVVQPTPTWLTGLIVIPAGLLILLWLGTLATKIKPTPGLLFVIALIVMLGLAGINVLVAAVRGVTDANLQAVWSINQTSLMLTAVPLVLALGGLVEFAPIIWGRKTLQPLVGLAALAGLGGGVLAALGHAGIAYKSNVSDSGSAAAIVSFVGGLLLAAAVALTLLNLLGSIVGGKGEAVEASISSGELTEVAA